MIQKDKEKLVRQFNAVMNQSVALSSMLQDLADHIGAIITLEEIAEKTKKEDLATQTPSGDS